MSNGDTCQDRSDLAELAKRTATVAAVITGFVAGLGMLIFGSSVFFLAFAGILLSVFLRRLSALLASHTRLSYGFALAIVLAGLLGLAAGLVLLVAPSFASQAQDLRQQLPGAVDRLRSRIEGIDWLDHLVDRLPPVDQMVPRRADVWSRITGFFSTALGLLTDVVVIGFVGLYLAVTPNLYRRGALALVPPRHRKGAENLLSKIDHTLWWWLIAKLIAMVIVGGLTAVGLWWLEVPAPAALGALAALLTFIPNFGPVLAAVPAIVLAMTQGVKAVSLVILLYLGIQAVESYLITPNIEKQTINLPPALTITAQLLLGILGGGLGLFVATPLCATGLVLVRELYVRKMLDETPSL